MKKVVNLVTNYMSALCETGRVPGRVDRNIKAGTAVYFPGGGGHRKPGGLRTGIKRVFSINSHTTNAYPITKKVHETDPTYQNYMNGFFKAFRVPVRVRYHNGLSLNGLK